MWHILISGNRTCLWQSIDGAVFDIINDIEKVKCLAVCCLLKARCVQKHKIEVRYG